MFVQGALVASRQAAVEAREQSRAQAQYGRVWVAHARKENRCKICERPFAREEERAAFCTRHENTQCASPAVSHGSDRLFEWAVAFVGGLCELATGRIWTVTHYEALSDVGRSRRRACRRNALEANKEDEREVEQALKLEKDVQRVAVSVQRHSALQAELPKLRSGLQEAQAACSALEAEVRQSGICWGSGEALPG